MLVRIQRQLSSKWLLNAMQWCVPVVALYFVFQILSAKADNQNFIQQFNSFFSRDYMFLIGIALFGLTFLNLFCESLKWKVALLPANEISYMDSVSQTMMAMAAGFITPFRSGAILSRLVSNENDSKANLLCSMLNMASSQFIVTVMLGLFSLSMTLFSYSTLISVSILIANSIVIILVGYFMAKQKTFRYHRFEVLELKFRKDLFLLSLVRYLIFTFQFFLLLRLFNVSTDAFVLFPLIGVTYLVNTLVPAGILGKIGIRELSGILIIGETTGFVLETACASFGIWILNQAFPALIGSVLFIQRSLRQ